MNLKKISLFLILFLIILGAGFLSYQYLHKPSPILANSSAISEVNKSTDSTITQNPVKVPLSKTVSATIKAVKTSVEINVYWIAIFFVMACFNFLTILILFKVLAWRQVVSSGMVAVLPNEVVNTVQAVSENQNKLAQWLQSSISQVSKSLSDQVESVSILKKELASKEDELIHLKTGAISNEKEKVISKVLKLHSFLRTLEGQVTTGGIKHDVAISFLKDELADLFIDFDISEINPTVGSFVKDLPYEGYTVNSIVPVKDINLNQTVAGVLESGYLLRLNEAKSKVMRPASIVINKFGE